MRNLITLSGARTSKARRSVRGLPAVLASLALAAGLGSYPATAQEPEVSSAVAAEEAVEADSPIQVRRGDGVDFITVDDPDGEAWDYGAKASEEDIFALKRTGDGEIREILKVSADGETLDPEFYGFLNTDEGGFLAFDIDALHEVPPRNVQFVVRTSEEAEYAIAESDEVPTAQELSASGYGQNPNAAAEVNPDGVGMARAATLPDSTTALQLTPLGYTVISAASGGNAPRITIDTSVAGTYAKRDVYLTEIVLTYNKTPMYSLSGPVSIRKNGGTETCTVPASKVKALSTSSKGLVSKVSVDLTSCSPQIVVWQGSGDRIAVDINGTGTGNVNSDYAMEVYGSYSKSTPRTTSTSPTTSTATTTTPAQPTSPTTSTQPSPTTANQSGSARFSATSPALELSDVKTEGSNPYTSSVSVRGTSSFSSAAVKIDAPKSILGSEDYQLSVNGFDANSGDGYGLGRDVKQRTNDTVEIEFYPTKNGKRVDSAPLANGASFTLTSRFGGNAKATGTITINGQPRQSPSDPADAPLADGPLSGEYNLPLGPARLSTKSGTAQTQQLTAELLGTLTRRDVHPTKVRITYNGPVSNTTASLEGPVTFTKQNGETCTVQNPRPTKTERMPRGNSVVTGLEVDLTRCPIKFWEGAADTMSVEFHGPGGASGATGVYSFEAWGRRYQPNSSGQPAPSNNGGSPVDANGKCVSSDPEIRVLPRLGARTVSEKEQSRGTEVYVSTSAADNGQNTNRTAMTHSLLGVQQQGSAAFVPLGSSRWIYNGLAYNPRDNWLYAVSQYRGSSSAPDPCYPAGHLLQINPLTGAVRDLGEVLNRGVSPFKDTNDARDRTLLNSGVIHNDGLYVSNSSSSGSRDLYRVELPEVGSSNPSGRNTGFKAYSEDYAILPGAPQYAWGLVSKAAYRDLGFGYSDSNGSWRASDGVYIERINLETGEASRWELRDAEKRAPAGGTLRQKATWGRAWTYGNGNLGFGQGGDSTNQESPGVQLAVTDPGARRPTFQVTNILDTVPSFYNTDAASNARRTPPSQSDLAITKTVISEGDGNTYPGWSGAMEAGRTYWAIKVTNLGPHESPGSVVNDVVPQVYGDVRLLSEYAEQKDGFTTSIQISPNNRRPSASGASGTGPTPVQYVMGALQPGDTVWMYLSASLKSRAQCLPNTASVANNDIDADLSNNTASDACQPIVEIHKSFAGSSQGGSYLTRLSNGNYEVRYRVTVTNKTDREVWYEPPVDELALPKGFALAGASVTYTNEWNTKKITCSIDSNNRYLEPGDFTPGKRQRFRLQDCRTEDSGYEGFDGRQRDPSARNAARDHRHIDARKVDNGTTVTGMHTYDVRVELTVDEQAYLTAYPDAGEVKCLDTNGGLVNTAYLGATPSEQPCTYPPISRPELMLYKRASSVTGENISQRGVEFSLYQDNDGKPGNIVSGMTVDGDAVVSTERLRYDTKYWLVETKAPKDFSLLVEPVGIAIKKNAQGQAYVEVLNNQSVARAEGGQGNVAIMSVANVRQGQLPKTGGAGLFVPVVGGFLIVGVGAGLAGKRRKA